MTIYLLNLIFILIYGIAYEYLRHRKISLDAIDNNNINIKKMDIVLKKTNLKAILCSLTGVQLLLISALRDNVGQDVKTYKRMFLEIEKYGFWNHPIEKGFGALNFISSKLSENYQLMIAFSALITIVCISIIIYKYSEYPALSFYLYVTMSFYYSSMCLIRQGIAVAISLFAYRFIRERCFWKYLLIVVIATSFHNSALIMIPVYFILNINFDLKKMFWTALPVIIVYVFVDKIFLLLANLIPRYNSVYASEVGIARYAYGLSWKSMVVCCCIFILMQLFKKELIDKDEKNGILINISFASVLISLFQTSINVLDRLPYYMNIYMILSVPLLIDCFNKSFILRIIKYLPENKKTYVSEKMFSKYNDQILKRIILITIIFFGTLYNVYVFVEGYYAVLPYKSILF